MVCRGACVGGGGVGMKFCCCLHVCGVFQLAFTYCVVVNYYVTINTQLCVNMYAITYGLWCLFDVHCCSLCLCAFTYTGMY